MRDERVPVTLLTGFLGAGKTMLLNHLIRDPEAGRIAVVMNELGEVGLDHDLIEEATEETILMQSGCLCCSIRGDLGKTLSSLIARRMRNELDFDRVVIETTGIADPGPIMHTLVVDGIIAPHYRTDGVVTVVDAATGPRTLDAQFEAVSQIAMADLIVFSKTDLVTERELSRFKERVSAINTTATQIQADRGRVPVGVLFGLSAMRPDVASKEIDSWLGLEQQTPDPLAGISGLLGLEPAKQAKSSLSFSVTGGALHHDSRIGSASIEVEEAIPASVFDFWLDTLIALKGPDILRIKGIAHVEDIEWPFVFHGVQHIFDTPVPLKSWTGNDRTSRIVVIARDMDKSDIQASLDMLRMRPGEVDAHIDGMMGQASETVD